MKWFTNLIRRPRSQPASAVPPATRLREYLFVDERRLDEYVEQVHAPVTYDKVPLWSMDISNGGARFSGQQSRPARPLTTHEKVEILMRYLRTTKEFAEGRPGNAAIYITGPVFRCETCAATCVYLPARENGGAGTKGFRVWISDRPSTAGEGMKTLRGTTAFPGRLFLLEDDPNEDSPAPSYMSSFSTLRILAEVFTPRLLWSESDVALAVSSLEERFPRDPIGTLRAMGGQVLGDRWITALYRLRTGTEVHETKERSSVATFAYPIFIIAGHAQI